MVMRSAGSDIGKMPVVADQPSMSRTSAVGRAIVDRQTVHIHDLAESMTGALADAKLRGEVSGNHTVVETACFAKGVPIGAILIRRLEVRPFSDQQIDSLKPSLTRPCRHRKRAPVQELQERSHDLMRRWNSKLRPVKSSASSLPLPLNSSLCLVLLLQMP